MPQDELEILADQRPFAHHPRHTTRLFGHENEERHIIDAIKEDRMHHAIIVHGPEGIGKATFCYSLAKFLFHLNSIHPNSIDYVTLQVPENCQASRLVQSMSHPDLFVLRREADIKKKGKIKTAISVEDVRRANSFLFKTAAGGGWRVCIIDSADDLNTAAFNALLKTLEEPPEKTLFLLVSETPGRLPATILSRCTRLHLSELDGQDFSNAISRCLLNQEIPAPSKVEALFELYNGQVGIAVESLSAETEELNHQVQQLLDNLPQLDYAKLHNIIDKFDISKNQNNYQAIIDLIDNHLQKTIYVENVKPSKLAAISDAWFFSKQRIRESLTYNYDKKQTMIAIFSRLESAF